MLIFFIPSPRRTVKAFLYGDIVDSVSQRLAEFKNVKIPFILLKNVVSANPLVTGWVSFVLMLILMNS